MIVYLGHCIELTENVLAPLQNFATISILGLALWWALNLRNFLNG